MTRPRAAAGQGAGVAEARGVEQGAGRRQGPYGRVRLQVQGRRGHLAPGAGGRRRRVLRPLARRLEVVAGRVETGLAPAGHQGRGLRGLEVDPRQLGELRLDLLQVERQVVAVVDLELEVGRRGGVQRNPQLVRGQRVAHGPAQRRFAQGKRGRAVAGEPRLGDPRLAQEVPAADGQPQRHDGQRRGGETQAKAARAGLARPSGEDERRRESRSRRRVRPDDPREDPSRPRHARARRVVPGDAKVAEGAGRKRELDLPEVLVRQVEERRLRGEAGPALAVPAAVEGEPLQEGCPQALQPHPVDGRGGPEVGLEAARPPRRGDRQERRGPPPLGVGHRRFHEKVRHLAADVVVEPQVSQPAARHPARRRRGRSRPRLDTEGSRAEQEGQVHREALRSALAQHGRTAPPELAGRGRRPAGADARERGERREGQRGGDRRATGGAPHGSSREERRTNFWSASETRARVTARPTNEATR